MITSLSIHQEDPEGSTGPAGEHQQQLTIEKPPQASKTFEWNTTPNVVMNIKGAVSTKYQDPIHIW